MRYRVILSILGKYVAKRAHITPEFLNPKPWVNYRVLDITQYRLLGNYREEHWVNYRVLDITPDRLPRTHGPPILTD